jgi:thimet oligopeptidase
MKWLPVGSFILVLGVIVLLTSVGGHKNAQAYCVKNVGDLVEIFPKSVNEIKQNEKKVKEIVDTALARILAVPAAERNFANTILVFDRISLEAAPFFGGFTALTNLSPSKDLREASQAVMVELSNYINEKLSLNKPLYSAFKEYVDNTANKENLDKVQKYLLSETMAGFKRSGLDLSDAKLAEVRELIAELTQLSQEFGVNIAKDDTKVKATKSELGGLKDDFINGLKQDDAGSYILGCDYPTYFMIMDYCNISQTRKKMYRAFANRAYPKNEVLLNQIIAKRDQLAKMLGFASYAHLDLDSEMVKTPERALEFLMGVLAPAKEKAVVEVAELTKDLPVGIELAKGKLQPWDVRFVKAAYKKKHLNIDERLISEYFPLEHTIKQLLWVYEQFLDLKFVQVESQGFWSDEVRTIEVYDNTRDKLIGYLLLDLFPRPNKYTHAAQFDVVPAVSPADDIDDCPAVAVVMANFPRAQGDKDALMMYNDVNTFFHEFGHALHSLLGETRFASMSGTSVKTDFVEMPSQMLEDWLKDAEVLAKVSAHYQTGMPLPIAQINKIINLELFDAGDTTLRQLSFGLLALNLFAPGADKNIQKIYQDARQQACPYIAYDLEDHMTASFGHLTGYGAKYYGYMWSKVFAKDLFAHIKQQGLLNSKIGREYVAKVIGQGGQKDPNELLVDFLGREPNNAAFMHDLGFK